MKVDQPPAFLLDVDAWLTSARIAAMSAEEERAYFRLLMYQWKDPACSLPDDDALLAAMAKVPLELWLKQIRGVVEGCFIEPNRTNLEPTLNQPSNTPPRSRPKWCNPRLLEERKKWADWKEKSRRAGIKSGQVRKKKRHRTTLQTTFEQPSNDLRTKHEPNRTNSIPPHEEVVNRVGSSKEEKPTLPTNGAGVGKFEQGEPLSRHSLEACERFAESQVERGITNPKAFAEKIHLTGEADGRIDAFEAATEEPKYANQDEYERFKEARRRGEV